MEFQVTISEKNYNVYYRYRKVTENQQEFANDLLKHLLNFFNSTTKDIKEIDEKDLISKQIYEFPPTLDKDFLYLSCLFSLLKEYKKTNNNKKIIILANGIEKINSLVKMCSKINQYYYKKYSKENNNFNPIRVVPFYSRKQLCFNFNELFESNSFDMDTYCIKLNNSLIENQN